MSRALGILSCAAVLFLLTGCFQSAGGQSQVTVVSQSLPTFTPALPSDTPIPLPSDTPTELPLATQSFQPIPSPTSGLDAQNTGGELLPATSPVIPSPLVVAQVETATPVIDPLNLTATAIIAHATETQNARLTAEAIATFGTPIPTIGPTFTPIPGVPVATAGPVVPGANCVHEVRAGENLFRISLTYGVSLNDVAAASGIVNPSLILVGQRVTIPGCGTTGARPPATSTPEITVVPGTTPVVNPPTTGGTTYSVQQGDTLFAISLRFGVPVNSIAAANGITNINLIFINQQLVIPAA